MNIYLQIKMIVLSVLFFIFITYFVKKKKLQIKHSLLWYLTSIVLIVVAIFPVILTWIARLLGIIDITNVIFLIVIGFLLLIVFLNNVTISKHQETITLLVQEISILKSEKEGKADDLCTVDNPVDNACGGTDSVEG